METIFPAETSENIYQTIKGSVIKDSALNIMHYSGSFHVPLIITKIVIKNEIKLFTWVCCFSTSTVSMRISNLMFHNLMALKKKNDKRPKNLVKLLILFNKPNSALQFHHKDIYMKEAFNILRKGCDVFCVHCCT